MAQVQFQTQAGKNCYAVFNNAAAPPLFWNQLTTAFEVYNSANWTSVKYCVTAVESSPGTYTATVPAGVTGGNFAGYIRAGGSPATTDLKIWSDPTFGNSVIAITAKINAG